MACRNPGKAESARSAILVANPSAILSVERLDLATLASIRGFADRRQQRGSPISALINNAGVLVPFARTEDGFEMNMEPILSGISRSRDGFCHCSM